MKSKQKMLFFVQDTCKLSTLILLILSFLAGFSIIYARQNLGGPYRVENIYAMFSTISDFLLIFLAVNLLGKEFQSKAINMIRVSNRSDLEIIVRKLLVMVGSSVIIALVAFSQVAIEYYIYGTNLNLLSLLGHLVISYVLYGIFLFDLGSILVLLIKNTLYSFIALLLTLRLGVAVMNIISNIDATKALVEYIPLSFAENAFYFANYSSKQILIMICWEIALTVLLPIMFKQRGYK